MSVNRTSRRFSRCPLRLAISCGSSSYCFRSVLSASETMREIFPVGEFDHPRVAARVRIAARKNLHAVRAARDTSRRYCCAPSYTRCGSSRDTTCSDRERIAHGNCLRRRINIDAVRKRPGRQPAVDHAREPDIDHQKQNGASEAATIGDDQARYGSRATPKTEAAGLWWFRLRALLRRCGAERVSSVRGIPVFASARAVPWGKYLLLHRSDEIGRRIAAFGPNAIRLRACETARPEYARETSRPRPEDRPRTIRLYAAVAGSGRGDCVRSAKAATRWSRCLRDRGKSAIYRVPALMLPGPTVVVSPASVVPEDAPDTPITRTAVSVSRPWRNWMDGPSTWSAPQGRRFSWSTRRSASARYENFLLVSRPVIEAVGRPLIVALTATANRRSGWKSSAGWECAIRQ